MKEMSKRKSGPNKSDQVPIPAGATKVYDWADLGSPWLGAQRRGGDDFAADRLAGQVLMPNG